MLNDESGEMVLLVSGGWLLPIDDKLLVPALACWGA